MPMLRPLDPAFPIERQLSTEASAVVLINLLTDIVYVLVDPRARAA